MCIYINTEYWPEYSFKDPHVGVNAIFIKIY